MSFVSFLRAVSLAALLMAAAGCMNPPPRDPARVGPFYEPKNFVGDSSLFGLRRVVLLPAWGGSGITPEQLADLDAVLVASLQRQQRFEVVTLSRSEFRRRFGLESVSSAAPLPFNLLGTLRRETGAEAILFVDVTMLETQRPLGIGLRARLATVDGLRLMWVFDNLFSSADPAVANSARRHELDRDGGGVPADMTLGVLQSPGRFATYAADAMFRTLPPVVAPVVPGAKPAQSGLK